MVSDHNTRYRNGCGEPTKEHLVYLPSGIHGFQGLLLVHDPKKIWIDANVKETDIRKVEVGQNVDVTVDAFPDKKFGGRVIAIGNAATSEFALLPTPNPSGNFTKITQRLRVRVAIDQEEKLLRPGMMVEIFIDVR